MVETGARDRIQGCFASCVPHANRRLRNLQQAASERLSPRRQSKLAEICVRLRDLTVPRMGRIHAVSRWRMPSQPARTGRWHPGPRRRVHQTGTGTLLCCGGKRSRLRRINRSRSQRREELSNSTRVSALMGRMSSACWLKCFGAVQGPRRPRISSRIFMVFLSDRACEQPGLPASRLQFGILALHFPNQMPAWGQPARWRRSRKCKNTSWSR